MAWERRGENRREDVYSNNISSDGYDEQDEDEEK